MAMYEIYFSPTGGTKKVTEIIGSAWACEAERVDLMNPALQPEQYVFSANDICIVAVPSFGGRVPVTAVERLKKMAGNGARAVLVAVYGNREFEDTLTELKDVLSEAGFRCSAAAAAVAEHSIIRKFGAGRPDKEDCRELKEFSERIKRHLEENGDGEVSVPGGHPYREYHGVPMKPKADKDCIKCGKCASECPVQAIPKDNPSSLDKERCISCMHCIAICPEQARRNDKVVLFAAEQKMKKACSGRKANTLYL